MLWAVLSIACVLVPVEGAVLDREVPNFNLLDLQGRDHELYRAEGRAVVLFFTGNGCPIARKSVPRLRDLRRKFAQEGVSFWMVHSYPADTTAEISREVNEIQARGMLHLRDPKQGLAIAFAVERTAEVVAIDLKTRRVFYQGAVDDQFVEGAERPSAQTHFLRDALTQHLAGQTVANPRTPARGCRLAFAPAPVPHGVPSYATDVAPILKAHCVACHRDGAIGPWSMNGHGRLKNKAAMIEEVLLTRRMPPWDPDPDFGEFQKPHYLTREDTQTLLRWVKAGAPRGEGEDPLEQPLPPLSDWALGKPDAVLRLPKPEEVPATGVLNYRHIRIHNPFTNDVWISGSDVKPSNRKVVHHAILYAFWPGCPDDGTGQGVHFQGWAPGTPQSKFPDGVAKRLPAGAELTLEMHYTTCGSEQTDQTEVAFYLAPGPQPREAFVRRADAEDVDIPAGVDEARHHATYAFRKSATIYGLAPHMHVRGKWMRYELLLPNGHKEVLLHVPRYDFNWQHSYGFTKPRHVPAGSWLLVSGAFDNSASHPGNPDPTKRVRFGLQSWDEMFIGFFDAADDPDPLVSPQERNPKSARGVSQ